MPATYIANKQQSFTSAFRVLDQHGVSTSPGKFGNSTWIPEKKGIEYK
jgi:hypothetical protein